MQCGTTTLCQHLWLLLGHVTLWRRENPKSATSLPEWACYYRQRSVLLKRWRGYGPAQKSPKLAKVSSHQTGAHFWIVVMIEARVTYQGTVRRRTRHVFHLNVEPGWVSLATIFTFLPPICPFLSVTAWLILASSIKVNKILWVLKTLDYRIWRAKWFTVLLSAFPPLETASELVRLLRIFHADAMLQSETNLILVIGIPRLRAWIMTPVVCTVVEFKTYHAIQFWA